MQNINLPKQSAIYKKRNAQERQNFIRMNINGPPVMNNIVNIVNQESSNSKINQTEENLIVNNNIKENIHNFPLTDNRNIYPAPPIIIKQKNIFYKSVNPKMNNINKEINTQKEIIIKDNANNNENNVQIINNIPPQSSEGTKEERGCEDICCCILKIFYYLFLFPMILCCICFLYCLYCMTENDKDLECIHCCLKGLCFKKKRRR